MNPQRFPDLEQVQIERRHRARMAREFTILAAVVLTWLAVSAVGVWITKLVNR